MESLYYKKKYNGVTLAIDGSTLEATDENIGTNEAGVRALSALDIRSYGNKVTVKGSHLSFFMVKIIISWKENFTCRYY